MPCLFEWGDKMTNQPMQWPTLKITVFYDKNGTRASKVFENQDFEARRFYTQKFRDGKNPKLKVEKE
jgi:hypothetical protein